MLQDKEAYFWEVLGQPWQKMIEELAKRNHRTPLEELRSMIERRAFGHSKDLGDDQGGFRLYEGQGIPRAEVEIHE